MSVFMGDNGMLTIQRSAIGVGAQGLATLLEPADVTPDDRRFSADFPRSAVINGDRVEIATQDGSNLQLVKGHDEPDGYWYAHVDKVGSIRLYTDFAASITGAKGPALELVQPSAPQSIYIRNRDEQYNCVGKTASWSLTTTREAVDISCLGTNFRENYANGMISGQGETECFWDFKYGDCDGGVDIAQELPNYYAQLILRLEQGSFFKGRFFCFYDADQPGVWYDADCVVTNVGFSFAPGEPIKTTVQFVTTGEIKLIVGEPDRKLLQESTFLILEENDDAIQLENED